MDLEKLRCCVSLSRHLNFTRAAEENFISQPSMTQKINSLEQELGVQLFRRSNREVSLTEAGRSFVQDAQAILLAYQDAVLRAQSIQAREPASPYVGLRRPQRRRIPARPVGAFPRSASGRRPADAQGYPQRGSTGACWLGKPT